MELTMLPLGRLRDILGKYNIVIVIFSVPEMRKKHIIQLHRIPCSTDDVLIHKISRNFARNVCKTFPGCQEISHFS